MLLRIANKTLNGLRMLKKHPALRKFIVHNKQLFPTETNATQRKPVVLFELNAMHSAHISYSYLANVLAANNQAKICAHLQRPHRSLLRRLLFNFRKATDQNDFAVYKSFGTTALIEMALSPNQKTRAKKLFAEIFGRLSTKLDIEALTINDVWIGDLVYDSFLMHCKKPTIDRESPEFRRSMLESIEMFVFWEDYMDSNDVRAINVSHCVYNLAIPLRIAVHRSIPVFQVNATYVYRLSSNNLFAYNDFVHYRERFAALPPKVQEDGIAEARRRIERRFAGEAGVDMRYSSKSAYGASRHAKLLKESRRKKY